MSTEKRHLPSKTLTRTRSVLAGLTAAAALAVTALATPAQALPAMQLYVTPGIYAGPNEGSSFYDSNILGGDSGWAQVGSGGFQLWVIENNWTGTNASSVPLSDININLYATWASAGATPTVTISPGSVVNGSVVNGFTLTDGTVTNGGQAVASGAGSEPASRSSITPAAGNLFGSTRSWAEWDLGAPTTACTHQLQTGCYNYSASADMQTSSNATTQPTASGSAKSRILVFNVAVSGLTNGQQVVFDVCATGTTASNDRCAPNSHIARWQNVPTPSGWALLVAGVVGFTTLRRRRMI